VELAGPITALSTATADWIAGIAAAVSAIAAVAGFIFGGQAKAAKTSAEAAQRLAEAAARQAKTQEEMLGLERDKALQRAAAEKAARLAGLRVDGPYVPFGGIADPDNRKRWKVTNDGPAEAREVHLVIGEDSSQADVRIAARESTDVWLDATPASYPIQLLLKWRDDEGEHEKEWTVTDPPES
jgi:hypothetical protein